MDSDRKEELELINKSEKLLDEQIDDLTQQLSAAKDLKKKTRADKSKIEKQLMKEFKEMGITPKSSPVSDTSKSDKKKASSKKTTSKKESDTSDSSDSSSASSMENSSKKISKNLRERMEKASKGKTDSAGGANKDQIQSWICKYSNKSLEDVSKMSRDELQSYLLRILKKH